MSIQEGVQAAYVPIMPTDLFGPDGIVTVAVGILLFAVGAISVFMIILGGLRYVVSGGNEVSVTAARNTILYAIIGLIISFLAFSVVRFVLSSFFFSGPTLV